MGMTRQVQPDILSARSGLTRSNGTTLLQRIWRARWVYPFLLPGTATGADDSHGGGRHRHRADLTGLSIPAEIFHTGGPHRGDQGLRSANSAVRGDVFVGVRGVGIPLW